MIDSEKDSFFFQHLIASLTTCLLTIISVYSIAYFWLLDDNFNAFEITILSVLLAFIGMIFTIISNIYFINLYRRKNFINQITSYNKVNSVITILIISNILIISFDFLFFISVDNSIPYQYAKGLEIIIKSTGASSAGMNEFYKMPFVLQNFILNFLGLLIGGLSSIPFIKKNGASLFF